jgi:DNA-binding SARP family transcriptional activator
LSEARLRVYLAGRVRLERGDVLVDEARLPGRQGRIAFAMLAAEHERAVSKDELFDELWRDDPPSAPDIAIRAIVSKIRALLRIVGLDGAETLAHAFGCYQLRLPPDAWVDVEVAADAVHRAEAALRDGDHANAMGWSLAANAIAGRGFLPGEDGRWTRRRREALSSTRVRALECRSRVHLERGAYDAAARDAEIVIDLEPFRETAYRLVMNARAAEGNPAEALRAYERCRRTIADELGVGPSAETEALYLEIVRSS